MRVAKILAQVSLVLVVTLFTVMWITASQGHYYQYRDVFNISILSIIGLFSIPTSLVVIDVLASRCIRHSRDKGGVVSKTKAKANKWDKL